MSRWKTCTALSLLLTAALPACNGGKGEAFEVEGKERSASGKILSISEGRTSAKIAHGDIEDFMPAMTMEFFFREPSLAEGLQPEQDIAFRFGMARTGQMVIVAIESP